MTVAELRNRMSAVEVLEWAVYLNKEHWENKINKKNQKQLMAAFTRMRDRKNGN